MSPLPLARRYARSDTAFRPTLFLPANLLDDVHHQDVSQPITVTVTVTKWYPTPQPTSAVTGFMPGMSGDAMVPSAAELPTIRYPTSEMFASPTSSSSVMSGVSSGTSFRSSLVAGTVAGVLILTAQAAAVWYILCRRRRRGACAPIRIERGSERPSIEPTSSRGASLRPRESALRITPYEVDEAPPSYDALDRKTNVAVAPPEPALVRPGTSTVLQNTCAYVYGSREESRPPSSSTTSTTHSPSRQELDEVRRWVG